MTDGSIAPPRPPGPPGAPFEGGSDRGPAGLPVVGTLDLDRAGDATLTARAADGDVKAFTVLVRRHGPVLRAYAIRVLGSATDSDDVVQDTFVTAWDQLPKLQNTSATKSWLIRIATRKALDRLRARRDHADVDDHDVAAPDVDGPARQAESSERDIALQTALSALPEDQRRTWLLRELGGYSYAEIADELSIPASTVRGALARARKTLMTQMEGWR